MMSSHKRRNMADISALWSLFPGVASIVYISLELICRFSSFNSAICESPRWWAFASVLLSSGVATPVVLITGILLLSIKRKRDSHIKGLALFGIVSSVVLPVFAVLLHQGML